MKTSILATCLLALSLSSALLAQPIGSVTELQGDPARVFRELWQDLDQGDSVAVGDLIRTRQSTRLLTIGFDDGTELALDANSRLEIQRYDQQGAYSTLSGRVRAVVTDAFANRPDAFEIQTQTAIVGVQGTIFSVSADANSTRVEVEEGQVSVRSLDPNLSGVRTLTAGQFTIVRSGEPPTPPDATPSRSGTSTAPERRDGNSVGSGATLDREADGRQNEDPSRISPGEQNTITVPRLPTLPPQ